jgi:hypothetical protein
VALAAARSDRLQAFFATRGPLHVRSGLAITTHMAIARDDVEARKLTMTFQTQRSLQADPRAAEQSRPCRAGDRLEEPVTQGGARLRLARPELS